jgi:hypothetical protein
LRLVQFEAAVESQLEELVCRIAATQPVSASELSCEGAKRNDIGRGDKPHIRDLLPKRFNHRSRQVWPVKEIVQVRQKMGMPEDCLPTRAVFLEDPGARTAPAPNVEGGIGKVFRPDFRNRLARNQGFHQPERSFSDRVPVCRIVFLRRGGSEIDSVKQRFLFGD